MFKKHLNLKEPKHPSQKLWRYLKYERLLEIIKEEYIYFPHITKMSDKWEGLLTKRTKEKFFLAEYNKFKNSSTANRSVNDYENFKNDFYINSWHMNNHESYLMWKVYGNRGCAIQTTYERIKTSFHNTEAEITGGVVKYIDYDREQIPIGNTFWAVSHKDLPYTDEKEFRLYYWKLALKNHNLPVGDAGIKVTVDVDILIDNIYINPISNFDLSELNDAVKKKKLPCKINSSRIKE